MKRRVKPRLALTVDAAVKTWLEKEAAAHHLKVSQFVNQLLWRVMNRDPGATGMTINQIVNGTNHNHVKIAGKSHEAYEVHHGEKPKTEKSKSYVQPGSARADRLHNGGNGRLHHD